MKRSTALSALPATIPLDPGRSGLRFRDSENDSCSIMHRVARLRNTRPARVVELGEQPLHLAGASA